METPKIIKYEGDNSTFIWKHPCEDFDHLPQLMIPENQEAIFFLKGQVLDVFGPGFYKLDSQNIPLDSKVLNMAEDSTPSFHFEVYFVNKVMQMNIKWATDSRVQYTEPTYGFPLSIGAFGEMVLCVKDSRKLLSKLADTGSDLGLQQLTRFFRSFLMPRLKPYMAQVMKTSGISIFQIDENLPSFSNALQELLIGDFADYGVSLERFLVMNIAKPDGDEQYEHFKKLHSLQCSDMAAFQAKVKKLAMMKEAGILSDEEFNSIKADLLSEILK